MIAYDKGRYHTQYAKTPGSGSLDARITRLAEVIARRGCVYTHMRDSDFRHVDLRHDRLAVNVSVPRLRTGHMSS